MEQNEQRIGFERHAQSALTAAAVALLVWSGSTLVELRDRLTKMEERLATLNVQVNTGIDDRFRGTDWRREKQVLDERFTDLKRNVEINGGRISALERANDRFHGQK